MKILVAPDTVQVTSTLGRSTAQARATARPPCFHEIWLDCSDLSIYLVFTSGEIYRYDPNSIDTGRALIAASNHGLTFNQIYRLFGVSGSVGAYEKVTSIPVTAVMQYQNPPYAGVDPGPCGPNPFDATVWTQIPPGVPPTAWNMTPANGATGHSSHLSASGGTSGVGLLMQNTGNLTYTGPGGAFVLRGTQTVTGSIPLNANVHVVIAQGSTTLADVLYYGNGTQAVNIPFTLAPGVGFNVAVEFQMQGTWTGAVGATATLSEDMSVTP